MAAAPPAVAEAPAPVQALVDELRQRLAKAQSDTPGELRAPRLAIPPCPELREVPTQLSGEIAQHNVACDAFGADTANLAADVEALAAAIAGDATGADLAARAAEIRAARFDLAKSVLALLAVKSRLCDRLADVAEKQLEADAAALDRATREVTAALSAAGLGPSDLEKFHRAGTAAVFAQRVAEAAPVRAAQATHDNTQTHRDRLRTDARDARNRHKAAAIERAVVAWKDVVGLLVR